MTELKSCPFCGSEAKIQSMELNNKLIYHAVCVNDDCDGRLGWSKSESKAIEAWNTRAEQPRYHTNCDDKSHQCYTCKHSEGCDKWCSKCNEYSGDCYYELDDDFAEPTLQDIYDILESHDARLWIILSTTTQGGKR